MTKREELLMRLEAHPDHRHLSRESMERVVDVYLAELGPGGISDSGPTASLSLGSTLGDLVRTAKKNSGEIVWIDNSTELVDTIDAGLF